MELIESDLIGTRINMKGEFGTIWYFGQLKLAKAGTDNWYGIEWDNASKGKHNGTVEGEHYFSPQYHNPDTNWCSFIREGKLHLGISIKEAIEDKYQAYKNMTDEEIK